MNRAALIEQIQEVEEELSKSYWPCFNRHPSSAIDLSPTSIGRQGNTDEPAKLPEGPAS